MKLRRAANIVVTRLTNRLVGPLESLLPESDPHCVPGPIFIIGAPRSGTTLLFQLLTAGFDIAYFTNRHCRWFRAPALMERIATSPFGADPSFESTFGATKGQHAPSECGIYWYRFLPRKPHALSPQMVNPKKLGQLRCSMNRLFAAADRPLVFKNLVLSLRLSVLLTLFPNAFFIVVHREVLDAALSILSAREKLFGNIDGWFSVFPSSCMGIDDPYEQVIEQVHAIYENISGVRSGCPPEQFIDVHYEDLCQSPALVLDNVQAAASGFGLSLSHRSEFDCPAAFSRKGRSNTDQQEWHSGLQAALSRRNSS